jgi:hypothetical protein
MKDTITGDDPFYGPREAKCVAPTGHTNAITGPRADHSQPKTSVKDREISRFSASMPARELQWGGQNAQNPVTAHFLVSEKASRATTKWVDGPKWRGQTAKAQSLASKPPILTEDFGSLWSARGL